MAAILATVVAIDRLAIEPALADSPAKCVEVTEKEGKEGLQEAL